MTFGPLHLPFRQVERPFLSPIRIVIGVELWASGSCSQGPGWGESGTWCRKRRAGIPHHAERKNFRQLLASTTSAADKN